MNIRMNIERFDQKFHRFEHNLVMSSEKLIHQEAFWSITIVAIMILGLIVLSILAIRAITV
jgi:hypothetical protein